MRRALFLATALASAGCISTPSEGGDDDGGTDGDDAGAKLPDAGDELLANGGFEEGVGVGWIYQPGGAPRIDTADELGVAPQGGEYVAEVGDSDNISEVISQEVEVPVDATDLTLAFHRCVLTAEPMAKDSEPWDFCYVRVNLDGELYTLLEENNLMATESCEWVEASVAVPFTPGAPLEILLVAANDVSDPTRCLYDSFALVPTF